MVHCVKKIVLFFALSLWAVAVVAKPVSQDDAGRMANHYWQTVLHGSGKLHACP
ncbi:MAG: hypothetical protein IJK84_03050 [Bacteroidales bacterium]|nr:hypothetical protein [Bacteroidales bacterium]